MPEGGLFIGWGNVVRGREQVALQVFNEAIEYYSGLQQQGEIDSFEPVFLEPHGGDLLGFILLRGDTERLSRIRARDDFVRLNIRANMVVESFGVVGAFTGDAIAQQTALFQEQIPELT